MCNLRIMSKSQKKINDSKRLYKLSNFNSYITAKKNRNDGGVINYFYKHYRFVI